MARGFGAAFELDGEDLESAFGLCMQVNFEEFGQTKTYDLCPNGGEVPVTKENRNEYVRLYAKYPRGLHRALVLRLPEGASIRPAAATAYSSSGGRS